MFCPNCRRQLPDGTKFCSGCGTPIRKVVPPAPPAPPVEETAPVEPVPVESVPVESVPTPPVAAESAPETPAVPVDPPADPPAEKPDVLGSVKDSAAGVLKKIPVKYLKLGGIAAAALAVLVILICLFASGSGEPNYVAYIKDEQVYFNDFSGKAPFEITKDLLEDYENDSLYRSANRIGRAMHLTEDGSKLFYLDKLNDESGTLYYRNPTNPNQDPVKLDSKVTRYAVSENGKTVTYLRDDTLYQHNLKDDTKIAKEVDGFTVSADGKTIFYNVTDDEETVYYLYSNGKEEEVCSGAEIRILYNSTDYRTVYYMDDDTLYRKEFGKKEEKLESGISQAFCFTDQGTFYYMEQEDVSLADYFVGDDDHTYWMEELEACEATLLGSLYYYNGKEGVLLSEACQITDTASFGGNYVIRYIQGNSSIGTFSMAQLEDAYYNSYSAVIEIAQLMVREAMTEDSVSYLAINGVSQELELEDVYQLCVSPDGKVMYALCDVNEEKEEGDLYKAAVSGNKVGEFEEVDDSVSSEYGMYFIGDSEKSDYFYYFKDVEDYIGELFINGESLDEDVYVYGMGYNAARNAVVYTADFDTDDYVGTLKMYDGKKVAEIADDVYTAAISDDGKIAYMTDYDTDKGEGTLYLYNGKKSVEISEDVFDFLFTPDGEVVYLFDYSLKNYRGDLAIFNGRKSEALDEDVVALISVSTSRYHYFD